MEPTLHTQFPKVLKQCTQDLARCQSAGVESTYLLRAWEAQLVRLYHAPRIRGCQPKVLIIAFLCVVPPGMVQHNRKQ
jgi:hypothetical protein